MTKVASGEIDRLPQLFDNIGSRLTTAERWSVYRLAGFPVDDITADSTSEDLTAVLGTSILAELVATGESTLLEWLIAEQRLELDDPGFRRLIDQRCELALRTRLEAEADRIIDRSTAPWTALRELASNHEKAVDVFLAGSTLLAVQQDLAQFPEQVLELGTIGRLTDVEAQLWLRGATTLRISDRQLRVRHLATGTTVNVFRYRRYDEHFGHGNATYTRWHRPFGVALLTKGDHRYNVPENIERYLDERFGHWQTPTLFFDRVFDAPNTTPDNSLESLIYLYRRAARAFARGSRFYADAAAERMRDTFGIDYSMYVPQPVHPKVLSLPFDARNAAGREVVVMADGFHTIDASTIGLLERARLGDRYLVAAIHDDGRPDVNDRVARVKTLRSVDHVTLFASRQELQETCDEVGSQTVLLRPGSDVVDDVGSIGSTDRAGSQIRLTHLDPVGGGRPS